MTEVDNSSELTPEQENTTNLLERMLGRAIANRYVDFCRLASGAFELRVSRPVAGHALRELESTLRDALKVPLEVKVIGAAIDPEKLDRARRALEEIGFDGAAVDRAASALQPRETHATQIEQIAARLGLAPGGDIAKAWISLVKTFGQVHKRSFHHSLTVDDEFRRDFQRPFDTVVRAITVALQRRYSALTRRVDEIAAMPATERAVTLFAREIPGAMPLQWHFFVQLQSADWLPHLLKQGLIGPPLSESTGGSTGGLREWPAGDYLRRMAESPEPETRRLVASAIGNVAPSKHPDVRLGGLEAIAALPAAESATLAVVASEWLDRDSTFMTVQAAEKLVKKLATNGESAAALQIASRLLQVFGDDGEVSSLYAQHMYEYCLPQLAPALTKACGIDALKLFAALLNQAIAIDHERNIDPAFDRTGYDQGALVDETAGVHSVYDALRTEVRRAAEALIDVDAGQVPSIVEVFGQYRSKLFRRFEIYVLSKHPAALPDRASSLLLDADLLEASWCAHEYAGLARAWFAAMSPENQQAMLALVDAIPGRYVDGWRTRFEEHEKRPPTADDERVFNAHVVRDAVWHWRMLLPADRQAAVEAMGDPDAWKQSRWMRGEESPLTTADWPRTRSRRLPSSCALGDRRRSHGNRPSRRWRWNCGMPRRWTQRSSPRRRWTSLTCPQSMFIACLKDWARRRAINASFPGLKCCNCSTAHSHAGGSPSIRPRSQRETIQPGNGLVLPASSCSKRVCNAEQRAYRLSTKRRFRRSCLNCASAPLENLNAKSSRSSISAILTLPRRQRCEVWLSSYASFFYSGLARKRGRRSR